MAAHIINFDGSDILVLKSNYASNLKAAQRCLRS